MLKELKQMACGGCGGDTFKMFRPDNKENKSRLFVECLGCESVTEIVVSQPEITLEWSKMGSGDGLMTTKID